MIQNPQFNEAVRTSPQPVPDPILSELYGELRRFVELYKQYGGDIAITSPQAETAWAGRSLAEKQDTLRHFRIYRENCEELHMMGVSLRDNCALVEYTLKKSGLNSPENIRSFVENQSMVEVYNLQSVQVFRSINFFDYCNYSLLDLLAREWFVLYDRLASVTENMLQDVQATFAEGKVRRFTVPAHVMKEKDAIPRGVFQIEHQFCCPLYDAEGRPAAVLDTIHVTELDVLAAEEQEKFVFLR